MIHETEYGFVISSHGCWVTGTYKDKKAARYAFQFTDKQLLDINNKCRPESITSEDLKAYRNQIKGVNDDTNKLQSQEVKSQET